MTNRQIYTKPIGMNERLELEGDWEIRDLIPTGAKVHVRNGSLIVHATGPDVEISTVGDLEVKEAGSGNYFNATGNLTLGTAEQGLTAWATQSLKFGTIASSVGSPSKLIAKQVQGETTGYSTEITASEGDIELKKVGPHNLLKANRNLSFDECDGDLQASAGNHLSFGRIHLLMATDPNTVLRAGDVYGHETDGDITVHAEKDIRIEYVGRDNELHAKGDIVCKNVSTRTVATAEGNIYYESKFFTAQLNAQGSVSCIPWDQMPLPAQEQEPVFKHPLPESTAPAPTTTINQAEIIALQRRAALEDGQGI